MVNFGDPTVHRSGASVTLLPDLLSELRREFRDRGMSVRGWARAAEVGLASAQRLLDETTPSDPTLQTTVRLGLAVGLRLELVPVPAPPVRPVATPPRIAGATTAWSNGSWPHEDAAYLLALLGAELRWARRYGGPTLRSASQIAEHARVAPVTMLRMERPARPHPMLSNAAAVTHSLGFRLCWVPHGDPWRRRGWQQPQGVLTIREAAALARQRHGRRRAALYTALAQEWTTPPDLLRGLAEEFGMFTLDVAARRGDECAPAWMGPDHPDPEHRDALAYDHWADLARETAPPDQSGIVWMNPLYGAGVNEWLVRAATTGEKGIPVCCLIPARTDTRYWHHIVQPHASEIRFLPRLRFGAATSPAPFPSVIIIFGELP